MVRVKKGFFTLASLLFAVMVMLPLTARAATLPTSTITGASFTCAFPTEHVLSIDDGKLNVACTTNYTAANLSCVSVVYHANATSYTEVVQTNPTYSFLTSQTPSFTPVNGLLNVYFNKKNLLLGQNHTYMVWCSSTAGTLVSSAIVVPVRSSVLAYNLPTDAIWFKDTLPYWFGTMIFLGVLLLLITLLWRFKK